MSIHNLSAGSGYDYLTRQVAALDAIEKGHVGLASYYTERGESLGSWIGSGPGGVDGLSAGDEDAPARRLAQPLADHHRRRGRVPAHKGILRYGRLNPPGSSVDWA
jgi:hypothetical protein